MNSVMLGLALIAAATNPDPFDVDTLRVMLTEAQAANDAATLTATAETLRTRFPGHPTYAWLQARGQALQGEGERAIETLADLVARGVDMLPAARADEAFREMREWPAFVALERDAAVLHEPAGRAERAWRFGPPDTIPESVAFDGTRVYVGSVYRREVLVHETNGEMTHWRDPSFWSVLGMHLSPSGETLWLATAAMNVTPGVDAGDSGRSALIALDAESGKLVGRHVLPLQGEHVLGDFIFMDDTTLLATDSVTGGVYALDTTSGRYTERVAPGVLRSPQGLARIGDHVFIADYSKGLYRLGPDGELAKVADGPAAPYGIDGLYAHAGALIAIQNGVRPQQVARFSLSEDGTRIVGRETLLASHADFDEPTLGAVRDDMLYLVANSQWNRFTREGELRRDDLAPPVILSLPLEAP